MFTVAAGKLALVKVQAKGSFNIFIVKYWECYADEDANLALLITLLDNSEQAFTAPEMATISESAVEALDQILSSFEPVASK